MSTIPQRVVKKALFHHVPTERGKGWLVVIPKGLAEVTRTLWPVSLAAWFTGTFLRPSWVVAQGARHIGRKTGWCSQLLAGNQKVGWESHGIMEWLNHQQLECHDAKTFCELCFLVLWWSCPSPGYGMINYTQIGGCYYGLLQPIWILLHVHESSFSGSNILKLSDSKMKHHHLQSFPWQWATL